MSLNTDSMREVIDELRRTSISTNSDGNAPCTNSDLKRLRDNIANALDAVVSHMEY